MTPSKLTNSESSFDLVLDQVLRLVVEEDSQQFIYITGAAGTGKTTLIERVKDKCLLKKNGSSSYRSCCIKYWWQHN